jgi:hypothetical protein
MAANMRELTRQQARGDFARYISRNITAKSHAKLNITAKSHIKL